MDVDFLLQALILLGAIVLVVPLLQKAGAGSVPGYLVAGLLVGPPVLGWVTEYELIGSIAEFGVVFLLFSIGIELRPARLWLMRRLVFGLGTAQLVLCGTAIAGILYLAGFAPATALVCGLALALSSTAIVVQLLAERRELTSQRGRAAFAILLMQDVAVAPLITLVYLLGAQSDGDTGSALPAILKALGALMAVLVLGRLAWRRLLPMLAALRNADMLVAVALLLVLGAAWTMEHAGASLALGAFLAGVLLADSPFRHQVVADIQPFRGILLGLFFMSVGMSIDRAGVLANGLGLLGLASGLIALKTLLIAVLLRGFGLGARDAIQCGALLAQAGEFALILFALAASQSLMDADTRQLLYQVAVISMLLTPFADIAGRRLARLFPPARPASDTAIARRATAVEGHVVLCGFGRVGQQAARVFEAGGIPWTAIDLSSATIEQASAARLPVFYGDCGRSEILRALDVEHAALVLITLDDPAAAERTLLALRQIAPGTPVIARANDDAQAHLLQAHGVLRAVPETTEYSLQLSLAALGELGVEESRRNQLASGFRANDYARLLGRSDM